MNPKLKFILATVTYQIICIFLLPFLKSMLYNTIQHGLLRVPNMGFENKGVVKVLGGYLFLFPYLIDISGYINALKPYLG